MTSDQSLPPGETKPFRFYYGYVVVLASFLIMVIAAGTLLSFGVFLKPVLNEFDWSRAAASGAYSLSGILIGVGGILAGRMTDKFGAKLVLTVGGLFIGLGYLLMSRVSAIWQIYLFFGVFVGIGQSCMVVPLLSLVTRWFAKGRGLATGIVMAGIGIGIVVAPVLADRLISNYSWRTAYFTLGLAAIILIAIAAQFLRSAPGQNIISSPDANKAKTAGPDLQVGVLSVREAVCTRQFWIISLISAFMFFGIQSVNVHIVAHATDIGVSSTVAAAILSVIGFVNIGGNFGIGILADRIGNRNAVILIFILAIFSMIGFSFSGQLWMLYLFAVTFGLYYGGITAVFSPLVADFFGLRDHGTIFGLISFFSSLGSSLGPFIAGGIYDVRGTYQWAFFICAIMGILGLIITVLLKPAHKKV